MTNKKTAFWRRRRYQALGGLVGAMILLGLIANAYLTQATEPASAVSQYLSAIEAGQAAAAWASVQMSAPSSPTSATLVDEAGLQRALGTGAPDIKDFDITATHYLDADNTMAAVDVTYDTGAGSAQTTFQVERSAEKRFGFYPYWRVLVKPTIIDLTLPPASLGVTLDGQQLNLSQPTATIAVWPLHHRITLLATQMLAAQDVAIDAFARNTLSVAAEPKLTAAGQASATSALKAAFARCVAQTSLQPDGCPQSFDDGFATSGTWSLLGDPSQDVVVAFDKQQNLTASGHYQMVLAYQQSNGTMHAAVAGGFAAELALGQSDMTVASLASATDVPSLPRPAAATDDAIKAVVSKAMAACAASRSADPPDCPQQFFFPDATILGWTLSGDPLGAATVSFDPADGVFTVHGRFAMTATYELTSNPETESSSTTSYDAVLLWDGQAIQLITITGGYE